MTANTPAYVQIARQLHNRERTDTRPLSVRKVAERFHVSSVTASRALQLFRNPSAGEDSASIANEHWAVCLHVSPGPHQHAAAQLTADGFRVQSREGQTAFDFDSLRFENEADDARVRAGVALAVESGAKGIFLLPSRVSGEALRTDETLLAAAAEAGLPVVLLERNLRGEDRPLSRDLVCFNDFEGGRLLTRHLLGLGRGRIAFLTGSPTSSHVERLAGYLSALHSAGVTETLVLEHTPGGNPGAAYPDLVSRLIDWRADGVICFHEYAAVGAVMELLRRGRAVPDTIAVAAFYNLGLGESFSIGITSYNYPAQDVAARALDIMRWRMKTPAAPPVKVVVAGEMVIRNSTVRT